MLYTVMSTSCTHKHTPTITIDRSLRMMSYNFQLNALERHVALCEFIAIVVYRVRPSQGYAVRPFERECSTLV